MAGIQKKKSSGRVRASKACQRCSQRKVQCDGAELGTPCTRCRSDKSPECVFQPSRRGTYTRRRSTQETTIPETHVSANASEQFAVKEVLSRMGAQVTPLYEHHFSATSSLVASQDLNSCDLPFVIDGATDLSGHPDTSTKYTSTDSGTPGGSSISATTTSVDRPKVANSSLACMFEDFLERYGYPHEEMDLEKCGIILLGETSPLTFALKELRRDKRASMHDAGSHMSHLSQNNTGLAAPQRNAHPPHLGPSDITYLKSKGAFDFPRAEILSSFVGAFLERFYPLYSIVDKIEFERLYEQQKLPWILLHSVCFIGASYCDQSDIYKSGFKSRWHARRMFYDKAKILFDIGYETNKIILLQTVLMLSFWGPQMKSYWNPCSWIGFAVTIAESLGIHKSNASVGMKSNDKSLLRRLWWTLAVRDAYCAALLGRPFRINIAQCDAEMLRLTDFDNRPCDSESSRVDGGAPYAVYQVQMAELSLILRQIVHSRFGALPHTATVTDLHAMLQEWKLELPQPVDWNLSCNSKNIFATSLKIIYHHHLIFINLGKSWSIPEESDQEVCTSTPLMEVAESAAQTIAATAVSLIMNSMVGKMPHEVFPGFFFAGIVFYRQIRKPHPIQAQLGRAALDNCLMVMNEAHERWDTAQWVMRIFEFLISSTPQADSVAEMEMQNVTTTSQTNFMFGETFGGIIHPLHSTDLESPQQNQDFTRIFDDFMLMPNYFIPLAGEHMGMQFQPTS